MPRFPQPPPGYGVPPNPAAPPNGEPISLTVSQVNDLVRELFDGTLPPLWVRGEISNLSRPSSGHIYFTLGDRDSKLNAILWRQQAERVRFKLQDGMEVLAQGTLGVYVARGQYQLTVREIQPRGMGPLELAFRQLSEKLRGEGLFDPARKRPLPRFPRRVAFVTSPSGAAIHDFLEVSARRFPGTDILIVPARVQGQGAAREIVRGIEAANRRAEELEIDVLVVGRGGGSQEDLQAFNEEIVARALAASRLPTVSAVGHEIDVTISDAVADLRARTPSEAAELVLPSREDLEVLVGQWSSRLHRAIRNRLDRARHRLERLAGRRCFTHPTVHLGELARRIDDLGERARKAIVRRREIAAARVRELTARLEAAGPLAVLARGYGLGFREADGRPLRSVREVVPGERVRYLLPDGTLLARIEEIVVGPPGGRASSAEEVDIASNFDDEAEPPAE